MLNRIPITGIVVNKPDGLASRRVDPLQTVIGTIGIENRMMIRGILIRQNHSRRNIPVAVPFLRVGTRTGGEFSTYFKYPEEVRTLIYTTNAVEGFHRMLRKYTKTKTIYPTDDAVRKSVYLSPVPGASCTQCNCHKNKR